ncbi:MAG: DUF2786 domain-containing protein [Actinomycetota bacterium]|nr:DUF2786 domain-containing protein [Actinomycetota bacterium]
MSEQRDDFDGITNGGDRRLDTIRALLAKAEATEFPEEAEAFFAKASELISRWAIDEAMLWADTDASGRDQPDELQLVVHTPYLPQKAVLIGAVAQANNCRAVRLVGGAGARSEIISIIGFPTDLRWVETLVTSLLVQLTSAMLAKCPPGTSASATASWRRSFIIGYAEEVGSRLEMDRATAAARTPRPEPAAASSSANPAPSVELVLASRSAEVDDDFRRRHPHVRSSWASSGRSAAGRRAGRQAGREASLSRNGLTGRRSLGRG